MKSARIVLPGSAGLVGQNLVAQLKQQGYSNLIVLDKHRTKIDITYNDPAYSQIVLDL